jgi:hypothetical protein
MKQSKYYENQMKFHQAISRNPVLNLIRQIDILKYICRLCVLIQNVIYLMYAYHQFSYDENGNMVVDMSKYYWLNSDLSLPADSGNSGSPEQNQNLILLRFVVFYIHLFCALFYSSISVINKLPKVIDLNSQAKSRLYFIYDLFCKLLDRENLYNAIYCALSLGAIQYEYIFVILLLDLFSKNPVFKTL